ncbi:MAG: hypothetical protein KBD62_37015 [Kofleriaceae bacterium]|nr:hypothetical protein [Kofleriaceae bacterium]
MSDAEHCAARLVSASVRSPVAAIVIVAKNYARAAFDDPDPIGRLVTLAPIGHAVVALVEAEIADIASATRRTPRRWELAVRHPF